VNVVVDLTNVVEIAMWNAFLLVKLTNLVQQDVQLEFGLQEREAAKTEAFPERKEFVGNFFWLFECFGLSLFEFI
jgi:hypothetical protein